VELLTAQDKMTSAGLHARGHPPRAGGWRPEELENALRQTPGALEAYLALPPSRRKQIICLLQSAKSKATKQRRIERIVEEALS
jgi:uncharacterized protein YdeI (YjbR/CyaY-like superfamily)